MLAEQQDALRVIEALDRPCWQCGGSRRRDESGWEGAWVGDDADANVCGICHGRGRLLTDSGVAMRRFMRRWADAK